MKTIRKALAILVALSVLLLLVGCASTPVKAVVAKQEASQVEQPPELGTEVKIHFYDVKNIKGWGDCTFIEFPNGQTMLIDTGTQEAGAVICKDLLSKGITEIDYLVITHYHKDHVNGLREILPKIKFHKAYTTGYYPTDFKWVDPFVKQYVDELNYICAGDTLDVGSVHFELLWPFESDISSLPTGPSSAEDGQSGCNKDINNHSMVFTMRYKNNSVLFAADICADEAQVVGQYMNDPSILDCDILKIPHHGYSTSSSAEFLNAITPKYAFSMGTAIMDTSVFTRYFKLGCEVFMSWHNGNAYVTMDGENITVTSDVSGYAPTYATYVDAEHRMEDPESAAEATEVVAEQTVEVSTWAELKDAIANAKVITDIVVKADLVADQTITVPVGPIITLKDDGTARTISRGSLSSAAFTVADGDDFRIRATAAGNLVFDGQGYDAAVAMISTAGTVTLENLVFRNCRNTASEGGAVMVEKNILSVKNCVFENNYALAGAGIATVTKMVSITDIDGCTFKDNTVKNNGGALNIMNSNVLFLSNSTFTGNKTEDTAKNKGGAALYMAVTNSTISNCTFTDNVVSSAVTDGSLTGGAILYYCLGSSSVENTITGCTFKGNGGVDFGGGIGVGDNGKTRSKSGIVTVKDCTFESNSAGKGTGLGERFSNDMIAVTLTVTGCTFTSDTAYAPDKAGITWENNNVDLLNN